MAEFVKSKSLDAVAAVGVGTLISSGAANSLFTMQVIATGSPTALKVDLEGSLDNGTTWFKFASWDSSVGRVTGDAITVSGWAFDTVRANLVTLTGGTAPTVTAFIMAKPHGAGLSGSDGGVVEGDLSISDGSAPDTAGTITTGTGTVTATNLDGYSTVTFTISGTYAGLTAVFEQSDNGGTNWYAVDADRVGSGVVEAGCTNLTNAAIMYRATTSGSDSFRIRATALTSGTVAVLMSITALPTGSGVGMTSSFSDVRPDSGNITIIDTGSTTTAGYHSANQITGTPTVGSVFAYPVNGVAGWYGLLTGTWTGTLQFEKSLDGGVTWVATSAHVDSTAEQVTSVTGNCSFRGASAGATNIRIRATAAMTGTAVVRLVFAAADTVTTVTNLMTESPKTAIAAASTLTRPANATPYSINDSISDNATAGSVTAIPVTISDVADMPLVLTEIKLATTDTGLAAAISVRAYIFNSDPTANSGVGAGDNVAYSNKRAGLVGTFSGAFRAMSDGGVARLTPDEGNFLVCTPETLGRRLWIQYQTLTAFTPSANSTTIDAMFKGFQGRA